jgi:uncharacterized protein YkwD
VLIVVIAVAMAAILVAARGRAVIVQAPPLKSEKSSPCGEVGLPAQSLGLARARALTLCLLNEERAAKGLPPLRYEARLELASQRHSEDMVRRRFFAHDTPDGVDPQARILATGYPAGNAYTGENLAWGERSESSPAEIMDAWMHSPGHRENILRPNFTEVGVGVVLGGGPKRGAHEVSATYTTDFGGPPDRYPSARP